MGALNELGKEPVPFLFSDLSIKKVENSID
jgi:hypothetical protein